MNYYFPLHLNGGNRGCEAIAKGSSIILGEDVSNLIGLCNNIELDKRLKVSDYVTLVDTPNHSTCQIIKRKVHRILTPDRKKHMQYVYSQRYDHFLETVPRDGIVLSTGGDMFCYEDNEAVYTSKKAQERNLKTILWGCSIGEENLSEAKLEVLKQFSLVYVRESLSENLMKELGIKNVINFPDPAFILEPQVVSLPQCFLDNEVIGINISKFALGKNNKNVASLRNFIQYILEKTNLSILFIPHVLWDEQDDRIVSKHIATSFPGSNRISVLESEKYNYCEIRYIISCCKFFIGARTHSVISAYSTCVPSVALGYSIKSRGIAGDLGLDNELVLDCTSDDVARRFVKSFQFLLENEEGIRHHLSDVIPLYKSKLSELKKTVEKYF